MKTFLVVGILFIGAASLTFKTPELPGMKPIPSIDMDSLLYYNDLINSQNTNIDQMNMELMTIQEENKKVLQELSNTIFIYAE